MWSIFKLLIYISTKHWNGKKNIHDVNIKIKIKNWIQFAIE